MKKKRKKILWFVNYVTKPADHFSDWLKKCTTQNSQDWIMALLFLVGILFAFFYEDPAFQTKDRIQATVLWVTFIAILWYSKETFWLKEVQQKTLNHQRVKDDADIMPYLDCRLSYSQDQFLSIINRGKGLAKNIKFSTSFGEKVIDKKIASIPPGGEFTPDDLDDHQFLEDFRSANERLLTDVEIKGSYEDIFYRNYYFEYNFSCINNVFYLQGTIQFPEGWKVGDGI